MEWSCTTNEGVLDQLETFHYNRKEGCDITFNGSDLQNEHKVNLLVPKNVCANDGIFAVEAGVVSTSPLGPFVFPDGLSPVSPIVWLCSVPQSTFTTLVELKIPHCFESENVHLLKANHANIKLNDIGQRVIEFENVSNDGNNAPKLTNKSCTSVTVADDHFCIYCVGIHLREELANVHYCLTIVEPHMPDNYEWYKIHCVVHYNLPTCHKVS